MQSIDDIKDRAKTGNYRAHGDIGAANCIIWFSFGFRKDGNNIEASLSNQDLASFISNLDSELPIILQFETADALSARANLHWIEEHRQPGAYLDTREVADQAKAIMQARGWKQALVVAHPNHMPRVDAECQKLDIKTIVPDSLNGIRFDPESQQAQTRSLESWLKHELEAIDNDAARGWI